MDIVEKFAALGVDNAPGQECLREDGELDLRGPALTGTPVDFSHGDVDAHKPTPGSLGLFTEGVLVTGAAQAYTPYRGKPSLLETLAGRLSAFTGAAIDPASEIILTPGTQGALFLAMGASVMPGDKVAIAEPDYFANRKMVQFFHGEMIPVALNWQDNGSGAGIDLSALEAAFRAGARLFLFSNPNNPTGCVYSPAEIAGIAELAAAYDAALIVDQLYCRQIYDGGSFTHLCACAGRPRKLITIMGPSKTESLSGYRLGAAFGTAEIIERMEKLQAIMALRCAGYNQAVFQCWFSEPESWLAARLVEHQRIRDDLLAVIDRTPGVSARPTAGGSYLFVTIPELEVSLHEFLRIARAHAGVTVTPGTEFGPQFTHQFRLNFSQDHDAAVAALTRLFTLMERYRK